ncbi:hypothetical protein [Ferruginibacter profundus]
MKLHSFIVLFGSIVITITFIVALVFLKKDKPVYYKYILWFITFGLLVSAGTFLFHYYKVYGFETAFLITELFTLLQFVMLGLFYIEVLKRSTWLKKIKLLFCLSIIIAIILVILHITLSILIDAKIVANLFLIIFSVFYFRDLLHSNPTLILIKSSSFWIVLGVFFASCINFPIYSLLPFIKENKDYKNLGFQIFAISNTALIVMYLFIIKSYLCLKHQQIL